MKGEKDIKKERQRVLHWYTRFTAGLVGMTNYEELLDYFCYEGFTVRT